MHQRSLQREVRARLDSRQRVHLVGVRPAGQQVHAAAAQAPRAGPGQDEAPLLGLDQPVHLVEDQRNALHFVEHDPVVVPRGNQLPQPLRPRQQLQVHRRMVEQVEVERVRKPLFDPRGLPGAAGTEQEEAPAARGRGFEHSRIHTPILHSILPAPALPMRALRKHPVAAGCNHELCSLMHDEPPSTESANVPPRGQAAEFAALQTVIGALQPLNSEARTRILASVATFLRAPASEAGHAAPNRETTAGGMSEFETDLAEYWGQCLQRKMRGFRGTTALSEMVNTVASDLGVDYVFSTPVRTSVR